MQPRNSQLYRDELAAARRRWKSGETATLRALRSIYDRALADVQREMRSSRAPSAQVLRGIEALLVSASAGLTEQALRATLLGIGVSVSSATDAAAAIANARFGRFMPIGGVQAVYDALNERAVLAFATRTRFDGLRLSDRVWLHGRQWRSYVTKTLEAGVARGSSVADLARLLDDGLKTSVGRSSSLEVRRRIGLPRDVSYQSVRLARTEMANAYREGTVVGHGAAPGYVGIIWELSAVHIGMDICDELADGPNGDGFWNKGNEPMSPHPGCGCVSSPVYEDHDLLARRLDRWLNDPASEPALEDYHQAIVDLDLPKVTVGDVEPDLVEAVIAPTFTEAKRIGRDVAERVRGELP